MSATLASRVPVEFIGKARQLRDAIAAEDEAAGELITELGTRITDRIRRGNPIPRRDTVASVARDWKQRMPKRGQLAVEIKARGTSLAIKELRTTASLYKAENWDEVERGLIICAFVLEAGPFVYKCKAFSLAHISAHAIARRFQRGLDGADAAVMHDIKLLAQAHHGLADRPDGSEIAVPVAHGGAWIGTVETLTDVTAGPDRGLLIRTYLDRA